MLFKPFIAIRAKLLPPAKWEHCWSIPYPNVVLALNALIHFWFDLLFLRLQGLASPWPGSDSPLARTDRIDTIFSAPCWLQAMGRLSTWRTEYDWHGLLRYNWGFFTPVARTQFCFGSVTANSIASTKCCMTCCLFLCLIPNRFPFLMPMHGQGHLALIRWRRGCSATPSWK